jgi:glycosyltransferase involved in cell wall biosynthesis
MSRSDAIVIIATIGKPTLSRAIDSVLSQSHAGVTAIVVVDGPAFQNAAADVLQPYMSEPRVECVVLPQNTGANGFFCHRIYGAMPLLVNQDYIFYCDDDNWYEPNHVEACVRACDSLGWDWCFALRNIYDGGKFVCRDECESLGLWPVWFSPDIYHVDTNCYCLRRHVAVELSAVWHKSRVVDGRMQPCADTQVCAVLRQTRRSFGMVKQFSVNYELGSTTLSVKPEFFLQGNQVFLSRHAGKLPWDHG